MSKQVKCCKQTSALDVATQWACAELLQRWVCCITTTESSILLCHHKRDYIACMTQVAGSMGGVGVEGSGGGGGCRVQSAPIGSDGVRIGAVQLATTASALWTLQKETGEYHFDISSILTILFFTYSSAQPFPMNRNRNSKANIDTERQKKTLAK